MAPPPGTLRVSRYFAALGLILVVLYLLVFLPGNANTPKLGIDLVGGIRVIFTAQPPAGHQVTQTAMNQARQIIEDRINGSGVTASTVQIQGDDQLVVSIPGGTGTDVARLGRAAQLNFRPVIAPAALVQCDAKKKATSGVPSTGATASAGSSGSASATTAPSSTATAGTNGGATSKPSGSAASGSGSASGNSHDERPLAAPATSTSASTTATATTAPSTAAGSATGSASTSPSASASPSKTAAAACITDPIALLKKSDPTLTIPTTEAAYAKLTQTQQQSIQAALANVDCNSTNLRADNPKSYYVACESIGRGQSYAYLLGTVIVRGTQVSDAEAVAPSTGGQGGSQVWTVALNLTNSGQKVWGDWTTAHNTNKQSGQGATSCGTASGSLPCSDYVAFTLDGKVLSAPATNEPIVGQTTQISGSFTQSSATSLADQLKYGALPLSFRTDSNERVSASLGTSQLRAAFLAGGIGLALVVIYSLLYYRGLGVVTIASLVVSGLLTYAMMVVLGQQIGFTLDLAGIAGLIVALGITADSFVVFFERIKDEVHEGRSVRVAVPRGWVRARRTIISADVVSFLAAVILYIFASADVKGFAFTLGLSTVLDLVVVFLFTHPMVSLLSRSRAFGSPRFTGLNSVRVGGITPDQEVSRGKRAAGRAAASSSAAERAASRRGLPAPSTTAVADPDGDIPDGDIPDGDEEILDDPSELTDDPSGLPDDPEDSAPPPRRTTPQSGSAAERAAARRARQRDEKGE